MTQRIKSKYDYSDRSTQIRGVVTRDKREYALMADGSRRRMSPQRPWRGKSERRQVIKARREERAS